jgi:hypothetical protein
MAVSHWHQQDRKTIRTGETAKEMTHSVAILLNFERRTKEHH